MISKDLLNKATEQDFLALSKHFGIAIDTIGLDPIRRYADIEVFFLASTYSLHSSRIAEGYLCWMLRYGHFLSPSKIRRLVRAGVPHDSSVLGGMLLFLIQNNIHKKQWQILKPFVHKSRISRSLLDGPKPKNPEPSFLKYNIIVHNYALKQEKFLLPSSSTFKNSMELKNRALFGSSVHADIASYLKWNPEATPYQVAKNTGNHKARIFEIFRDVKLAL
jgi:hypothetical protein